MRLYRQTVEDFRLCAGLEIEDTAALRESNSRYSAKMRAVRIVSASNVSKKDLETRLVRKGETEEQAKAAVEWLEDLNLLDDRIPAPPHSGVLDPETERSVAAFQTFAGLPPTGEIDKRTWRDLSLYYTLAADQLENAGEL